jgi:hypothetical protein
MHFHVSHESGELWASVRRGMSAGRLEDAESNVPRRLGLAASSRE